MKWINAFLARFRRKKPSHQKIPEWATKIKVRLITVKDERGEYSCFSYTEKEKYFKSEIKNIPLIYNSSFYEVVGDKTLDVGIRK